MKPKKQSTSLNERHSKNELRVICARAENLDQPNIPHFDSLEQFTKSRIRGIKMSVQKSWKSLTSEFTKFETLLYINVLYVLILDLFSIIDNNHKRSTTIQFHLKLTISINHNCHFLIPQHQQFYFLLCKSQEESLFQ